MRRTPPFSDRLQQGVILGDGALGTYLHARGAPMDRSFVELCLSAPREIEGVHREYVSAGAEILTTNSYGANSIRLEHYGLLADIRRINVTAARLAREASGGRCYVAGSVGPLGAALEPLGPVSRAAAIEMFREQVEYLADGGVDFIVVETISDLEEFEAALVGAREACDLPIVVHKTFTEDGRTLMGELPHEVVARAEAGGAVAVGANCTVGPQRMVDIIGRMAQRASIPLSAMPTAGLPRLVDGVVKYHAEPEYMGRYASRIAAAGATIVGACCGSTPEHIAAMARALADAPERSSRSTVAIAEETPEAAPRSKQRQPSRLERELAERFVTAVDIDLPRSHDLSTVLSYGAELRRLGVRTVLLSDALRARLFVHPLVVAYRLQEDLGFETIVPFHTRDKNVLGIQSDLLAAHVLGVRDVFVSTSDPARLGDYPHTRTLSDVGAAGLVRIMDAMNQGLDLAGNPIGEPTAFAPIVMADPRAADLESEVARLRQQVEQGAVAAITPPQFETSRVRELTRALDGLTLPLVVGVLPLRSAEHADYLHNEVPGVHVPAGLRRRMAASAAPHNDGLAWAGELLRELREIVAGAHVIPPYRKRSRALNALVEMGIGDVVSGARRAP